MQYDTLTLSLLLLSILGGLGQVVLWGARTTAEVAKPGRGGNRCGLECMGLCRVIYGHDGDKVRICKSTTGQGSISGVGGRSKRVSQAMSALKQTSRYKIVTLDLGNKLKK
ncbi:hypothetical protein QBC37DRAFT_34083 [Rhypophila decipiens]|uniref:Uncharacterized protein n=1 Tax=Rhypophila decipiens TaxID=261697 RepID=A0AAN7BEA1_9PEZI|nr:hypothetical protein QBC37DRAFT_34083 [Rhypophila decipiens]